MAEIFATVASGAGLASLGLQLVDCAVKIKAFYENVEKAPRSLNRISREINTFALLLRQIDDTRARYGVEDSEVLQESIQICVECTEEIVSFTTRLEAILRRHHAAGRIYSALRMRDVQEICGELERAKNSLMMAFQVFDHRTQVRMMEASQNLALQQSLVLLQHGDAIAQIRKDTGMLLTRGQDTRKRDLAILPESEDSVSNSAASDRTSDPAISPTKNFGRVRARRKYCRFRLPSWFSNKIWEVIACRSEGRWELCLQTFNQRPAYSPIVAHYLAGRVGAVRELLQKGEASPNDVYGDRNALELAIYSGSRELLQLIQDCELVNADEVINRALLAWAHTQDTLGGHSHLYYHPPQNPPQEQLHIVRSLIEDARIDIELGYENGSVLSCVRYYTASVLPLINATVARPFQSLDACERLQFFEETLLYSYEVTPALFASCFPTNDAFAQSFRSTTGHNLLHLIVGYMAMAIVQRMEDAAITDSTWLQILSQDSTLHQWEDLLHEWIRLGSDLFALDNHDETLLHKLLWDCQTLWPAKGMFLIKYWAKCIRDAGLDLDEYGSKETQAWVKPTILRLFRDDRCSTKPMICMLASGFDYGATPDEWRLEVTHQVDVPHYRLKSTPGEWPRSANLPQSIIWKPSTADLMKGEVWMIMRYVTLGPIEFNDAPIEWVRLFEGTQDDNIALARLFRHDKTPQSKGRRRRGSQPPPMPRLSASGPFVLSKRVPDPTHVHYCPICCERILTIDPASHRDDHMQGTFSERPVWDLEQIMFYLSRWQQFLTEHSAKPVRCDMTMFMSGPLSHQIVEAENLFGPYGRFVFCKDFPDCLHQKLYLDWRSN